ncbi:hypothetical protein [Asanoa siamensis]|uniref:hypothetical protein n=1 Tax=Asanoa siamensis TaxID=926357 RepID=UPI001EF2D6FA|nr:hypothetical protein [Asanoa siamensis]
MTVTAPLVFFEWTHRWEEDQPVSTALWWTVGAAPVLAAALTAGRRRLSAGAVALVLVALSLAVFRWVIPLSGTAPWSTVVVAAGGLTVGGVVVGHRLRARRPRRGGFVVGAVVAVLGALLAQGTVGLGAEDSTVGGGPGPLYGGVGPVATPGPLELPAAGRYAIYAVGFAAHDPDCEVAGGSPVRRVTVPPADYGGDYASYAWVASFEVPRAGTFAFSCRTAAAEEESFVVGDVPEIRGAVASLIHWPLAAILLLGALPGLLVLADATRRRTRSPTGVSRVR